MRIKEIFNAQAAVLAKAKEDTDRYYKSKNTGKVEPDFVEDLEEDSEEDVVDEIGEELG